MNFYRDIKKFKILVDLFFSLTFSTSNVFTVFVPSQVVRSSASFLCRKLSSKQINSIQEHQVHDLSFSQNSSNRTVSSDAQLLTETKSFERKKSDAQLLTEAYYMTLKNH